MICAFLSSALLDPTDTPTCPSCQVAMVDIRATRQNVDEMLCETREILREGYFTELEEEHFSGRVDTIHRKEARFGQSIFF